ncbi:hypothetical protein GW755_01640 [bacterium]|nr:hypothetical protein [bacterium]
MTELDPNLSLLEAEVRSSVTSIAIGGEEFIPSVTKPSGDSTDSGAVERAEAVEKLKAAYKDFGTTTTLIFPSAVIFNNSTLSTIDTNTGETFPSWTEEDLPGTAVINSFRNLDYRLNELRAATQNPTPEIPLPQQLAVKSYELDAILQDPDAYITSYNLKRDPKQPELTRDGLKATLKSTVAECTQSSDAYVALVAGRYSAINEVLSADRWNQLSADRTPNENDLKALERVGELRRQFKEAVDNQLNGRGQAKNREPLDLTRDLQLGSLIGRTHFLNDEILQLLDKVL